jgi:hypothetical protein
MGLAEEKNDAIELAYEGDYDRGCVFVMNHATTHPHDAKRVGDVLVAQWHEAVVALAKGREGARAVAAYREQVRLVVARMWTFYLTACVATEVDAEGFARMIETNDYFTEKGPALATIATTMTKLGRPEIAVPLFARADALATDRADQAFRFGGHWIRAVKTIGGSVDPTLIDRIRAEAERQLAELDANPEMQGARFVRQMAEHMLRIADGHLDG